MDQSYIFEAVLGGIQLTLIALAAKLSYSFGSLNEKVDNLVAQLPAERSVALQAVEATDRLRTRVAVIETKIENYG